MKKHIPNTLTLLNLVSGCIAIVNAFGGNFTGVVIWVMVAAAFDFFDGFAARLLHAPSSIGKELDSLSDVVSFGVAPAMAVFVLLRDYMSIPAVFSSAKTIVPYIAFVIPAFSALRLAKFNLDERQTTSFIGFPTPANALFWISFCYGMQPAAPENEALFFATIAFVLLLSVLMVAEIPMFSLKIKHFTFKENEQQLLLFVILVAFLALWGILGIAWSMLAYIAISVIAMWLKPRGKSVK